MDAYPEREYLVADGKRRTYAEMEARANQLAHHLAAQGIGPGDHVGIYALNSVEWVETAWAVFKLRAVWININYRYCQAGAAVPSLTNAGRSQGAGAPARVRSPGGRSPFESCLICRPDPRARHRGEDGTGARRTQAPRAVHYEDALAGAGMSTEESDFGPRSPGDDLYILYTGGTTGMPKGVVWRHQDVFYALGGGTDPTTNTPH